MKQKDKSGHCYAKTATEDRNARQLIDVLKSKDKRIRYGALDAITKLSRSNKTAWKKEFLSQVLSKSRSDDREDRYVAMYAISRFYRKNWNIEEFKKQFLNVFSLLEDKDGRVRIAARNALDHFRMNFLLFCFGSWDANEKELIKLWTDSLFSLWKKISSLEEGKVQLHLIECAKILYYTDMDDYLDKKDHERYMQIWNEINKLDYLYNEYGLI